MKKEKPKKKPKKLPYCIRVQESNTLLTQPFTFNIELSFLGSIKLVS